MDKEMEEKIAKAIAKAAVAQIFSEKADVVNSYVSVNYHKYISTAKDIYDMVATSLEEEEKKHYYTIGTNDRNNIFISDGESNDMAKEYLKGSIRYAMLHPIVEKLSCSGSSKSTFNIYKDNDNDSIYSVLDHMFKNHGVIGSRFYEEEDEEQCFSRNGTL